jgi:hypothetical protein
MSSERVAGRVNVRQVIPRDAIPSVDDPEFRAEYPGAADDRVVAVEGADRARAYPLRYLQFHEVVNDSLDGEPVAVTWCPLCGSAVVYDRRHEGRTLEFGVSGKLAADDLVLYDRETGSEWKQSSGECLDGRFAGDTLSVRPASVLPWGRFRDAHPDGVVLRRPGGESEAASEGDTPAPIDYGASPYREYFESDGFGLAAHRGDGSREWDCADLDPKTVVLGVECGDEALGFPLPRVRDAGGVVRATVGGRDAVVVATDDAGIHGYADPGYAFAVTDGEVAADGTVWDPATGRAADGRALERLPTRRLFAFAWRDDHGPDAFYRTD